MLDQRLFTIRLAFCYCTLPLLLLLLVMCQGCSLLRQVPESPTRSGHLGATGMTPRAAAEAQASGALGALGSSLQRGQVRIGQQQRKHPGVLVRMALQSSEMLCCPCCSRCVLWAGAAVRRQDSSSGRITSRVLTGS